MRLSEAIRLGSMLKPQGFGVMEYDGRTCALGAARDASGGGSADAFVARFPILQAAVKFPIEGTWVSAMPIDVTIMHLNDAHRWTREQIADWLETVEAAQPDAESAAARITAQGVK